MRRDRILTWLPLVAVAACTIGMALLSASGRCSLVPWFCDERSMALSLRTMALLVLLLLLISIGRGTCAGVVQFVRTRRALKHLLDLPRCHLPATLVPLAHTLEIGHRLDVVDDAAAEAFCYGLLRPRICITTGLLATLSSTEVVAVLCHERHHLRRRDPLREVLWTVLDGACWWHATGGAQARLQRELAADRAVIAISGRQALASALLKLLMHPHGRGRHDQELAISGLSLTNARIDQLLHPELVPLPSLSLAQRLKFPAATVAATLLCSIVMAYL